MAVFTTGKVCVARTLFRRVSIPPAVIDLLDLLQSVQQVCLGTAHLPLNQDGTDEDIKPTESMGFC